MKESQAIEAMGALAHEVRLRIVKHLVKKGPSGDSAGAIGDAVSAAPSKLTFHISVLERAGMVSATRVSRNIVYRVNFEEMGSLVGYLLKDCCQNDSAVMDCCSTDKG